MIVEFKSKRNNTMDMLVRYFISRNAKDTTSLGSFESALKADFEKNPKMNAHRMHYLYNTEYDFENAEVRVYWNSPTKPDRRLVAVVKEG